MSDPKNIDWNEVVEDAQRLDMLRLQNEQNDLLREMSAGSSPSPSLPKLTPKQVEEVQDNLYGIRRADDPAEWERRNNAQLEKERQHRLRVAEIVAKDEDRRAKRKPWLIAGAVLVGLLFFGNLLFSAVLF